MDTKPLSPRQLDIDERLRAATELGLADWLAEQRSADRSFRTISLQLYRLTGDNVSDETLRAWVRVLVSNDSKRGAA